MNATVESLHCNMKQILDSSREAYEMQDGLVHLQSCW
jgi:hypothetical protein